MKTQTIAMFLLLAFLTGTMEIKTQAASINDPNLRFSTVFIRIPVKIVFPHRFWINYRHRRGIEYGRPYANACKVISEGVEEIEIDISKTKYNHGAIMVSDKYNYIEIQKQISPDTEGKELICPLTTIDFTAGNISYDEGSWKVSKLPTHDGGPDGYIIEPIDP